MAQFPVGKLNPMTPSSPSSTSVVGKLNFPGFQEILDFTSAGSESSVSVAVDGDTDKEYKIVTRYGGGENITLKLNNDSTTSIYGEQRLANGAGTVSAARYTRAFMLVGLYQGMGVMTLLTPTGFIKTSFMEAQYWQTGTNVNSYWASGQVYNSTSNITSLVFSLDNASNFPSGTRITVFARRSS